MVQAPIQKTAGHLPGEVFQTRLSGRRPRGRTRTYWRDFISQLKTHWDPSGGVVEKEECLGFHNCIAPVTTGKSYEVS